MNIIIVSQHFWPEQFRINMIAKKLVQKGYTVTVLTGMPNYPLGKTYAGYKAFWFKKEVWQGVNIYRVPLIPRGSGNNIQLILNYLSFMLSSAVRAIFIRKKFDACFVFQTSPIFQALAGVVFKKIRKVPLYLWVQDLWPESLSATRRLNNKKIQYFVAKFVRFVYKHCDGILMQSQSFAASISQYVEQVPLIYLPNTCEDFYVPLNPADIRAKSIAPGFKVMFAGNLGSAQALPTLVEAARIVKFQYKAKVKWILIGNGSQKEQLRHLIRLNQLDDDIILLDAVPASDMPEWLALTDVCLAMLNKSTIFSLTIPSKIQSYMSCAKPIISAIDGEVASLIKTAGCGKAVAAEDAHALAKAVLELKNMSATELSALGNSGRVYYLKHFQSNLIIDKLCFLFEQGAATLASSVENMDK